MSVTKTTVYLPDDLKRAVKHIAATSGRSEAEVIRQAISELAASMARPRPQGPIFFSGDPGFAERADEYLVGFGEHHE